MAAARNNLGRPGAVDRGNSAGDEALHGTDIGCGCGKGGLHRDHAGRERAPRPDQLNCGFTAGGGKGFTVEIVSGARAKTAADGYQLAASMSKGKIETIAGIGKRAWYDRSTAAL